MATGYGLGCVEVEEVALAFQTLVFWRIAAMSILFVAGYPALSRECRNILIPNNLAARFYANIPCPLPTDF